jgi:hypothetical protein
MDTFLVLVSLEELSLADNPLLSLWRRRSRGMPHSMLSHLDLSLTGLTNFTSLTLSHFASLQRLNLSHTLIHTIGDEGFQHVPLLQELDMAGSPMRQFPNQVFRGLGRLKHVNSENYKLCCGTILPDIANVMCLAPQDKLSTCEDLLRSGFYRGFLWLMGALSLLGNVLCLAFRAFLHRKRQQNSFNIFVSSLGVADCIMGVYMVMIGVADHTLRGQYLYRAAGWTSSVACRVAVFLCLVSCEVSALTVLLITLDRFTALRFPFSTLRFQHRAALLASAALWLTGIVLAAVPLLPATSHWQFYTQSGICIPLPVTRRDFQGRAYLFGVLIVLNMTLFVAIAMGQGAILWSVRRNTMATTDTTRKSKDLTLARRLITVAVTDFLCWFPIGVCGFLALGGVPIPEEMNVAMAIFVLPVNSAVNPFLYTFNLVMEKRRLASEERLAKLLSADVEEAVMEVEEEAVMEMEGKPTFTQLLLCLSELCVVHAN